ncbi:MAG: DUF1819 family protein [Syntrophomonas sp.]|nr:DUF1819 family protein [Syntrophomonas sp.]
MNSLQPYTTMLSVGLGVIDETRIFLELWQPGMKASELYKHVLQRGSFPNVSARRLSNLVRETFATRYLVKGDYPANVLKEMFPFLSYSEWCQLLFIFTCRVHAVLADYIIEEYWPRYAAGHTTIDNDDAREFILRAIEQGKTARSWSPKTIQNVAGYVTGCCADFGLLEPGQRRMRRIIPFRLEPRIAAFLAYDLHFAGWNDNALIMHRDWLLFGMDDIEVRELLKSLFLKQISQKGGV